MFVLGSEGQTAWWNKAQAMRRHRIIEIPQRRAKEDGQK